MTDDQQLTYKAAMPGLKKKQLSEVDYLQQYEPQFVDGAPENYGVFMFVPVKIDHLLVAPA